MRRARGLRRRFLFGALASAAISLLVFGAVVFALMSYEERDEGAGGDEAVTEAGELVAMSMLLAAPVGVIAAVITAAGLARRTTRPLELAIEAARESSVHDLSRRLPVPAEDGELRDLALAQNALFDRLDAGFGVLARFAADASHELRTPLTVIATELEVALRRPSGSVDWPPLATAIVEDTRRLGAIIDGLLALARAGADEPGARRRVRLLDLLDGVVAQLGAAAEARGVTLAGPRGDVLADVQVNPATFEIAIRNLIENAIRHAAGKVEMSLASDAGARIRIEVDDDGPGLGDTPERLFAPLVRGPGADRGAGAGLGLAIARRVIEAHGGTVTAGRAPSGGARLTVVLSAAP